MITSVKDVMDFVYASYFKRTVAEKKALDTKALDTIEGIHPDDDRNTRRPDLTAKMLETLKRPDQDMTNVLVTGSKGKGSVSRLLECILRAHGEKTGLFTSPHLHVYNERIQVDGKMISDQDLINVARRVNTISQALDETLEAGDYISPMGNGLCMALMHFKNEKTSYNILECGRGARFDDIAVAKSDYAVINIIFDEHLPQLGQSIEDVAWHKAGVISKNQKSVFSALQSPEVSKVLEQEAQDKGVQIIKPGAIHPDIDKSIVQPYNKQNANLAYTAAKHILKDRFSTDLALDAIKAFPFSGCIERVSSDPIIYLDGCIHPVCAKEIAQTMKPDRHNRALIGIPDNKAYADVVKALVDTSDVIVLTEPEKCHLPFSGVQAMLAQNMRQMGQNVYHVPSLEKAIDQVLNDLPSDGEVYIVGTQIYIGQVKTQLARRGIL